MKWERHFIVCGGNDFPQNFEIFFEFGDKMAK